MELLRVINSDTTSQIHHEKDGSSLPAITLMRESKFQHAIVVPEIFDETFAVDHIEAGTPIVIALPSQVCFAIEYHNAAKKRLPKHDALSYELEPDLPCDAEDLAIGAIAYHDGWLLVAVEATRIDAFIQVLRRQSIIPVCITPQLLLAWPDIKSTLSHEEQIVIVEVDGEIDLFRTKQGMPVQWMWLGEQIDCLDERLELLSGSNLPVTAIVSEHDPSAKLCHWLEQRKATDIQFPPQVLQVELTEQIRKRSLRIAAGKEVPLVDLRVGPLAGLTRQTPISKMLVLSLWSFLFLVAALASGCFLRAAQYRAATASLAEDQRAVFRRTFAGERVPVGITRRMLSERRQLAGTRGDAAPSVLSVNAILRAMLIGIPQDIRFEIDKLELLPQQIAYLDGVVRSIDDAERFVSSLRSQGFDVRPLSSSKTSRGMSLKLENVTFNSTATKNDESVNQ